MVASAAALPWEDVQLFLAVAEAGSTAGASRRLGVGQPTVSRRLLNLEYQLGFALFERRSDGVRLTAAGERLLAPARRMADFAAEVHHAAQAAELAPHGVVRVTAAPGVAWELVVPLAAELRARHPKLRLEVLADVEYLDLARGEADLALRQRPAERADLETVASVTLPTAVYVSAELRDRLPPSPQLAEVPWLAWARPFEHLPPNPQLAQAIAGFAPAFTSDNFLVLLRAAECGLGAIVLPHLKHDRLGGLVPLDLALGPHSQTQLHLVAARSALGVGRVALVARYLAEALLRVTPAV